VASWSCIWGEVNTFSSDVFSCPCYFFLVCSGSPGVVVPSPVGLASSALIPTSPTEQDQTKGNFFFLYTLLLLFLCSVV